MLSLILPLLIATLPGERQTFEVTDFIHADTDCTARCNIWPAVQRVFDIADVVTGYPPQGYAPGSSIHLKAGVWETNKTIELKRGHHFYGDGGGNSNSATMILVTQPVSAFRMPTLNGGMASITDLGAWLLAPPPANAPTDADFVKMDGKGHVEHFYARGFTHGIHVEGNHLTGTNVNGASIRDGYIELVDHAGVFLRGQDGNSITVDNVQMSYVCQRASLYNTALGTSCAGAFDRGQMGNLWMNIQVALTTDKLTGVMYQPYDLNHQASGSVCILCYSELPPNIPKSLVGQNVAVIGGISDWSGLGMRMLGARVNQLRIQGVAVPGVPGVPELLLGQLGSLPGSVIDAIPPQIAGSPLPTYAALRLRLSSDLANPAWIWDLGGQVNGLSERISIATPTWAKTCIRTSTASLTCP